MIKSNNGNTFVKITNREVFEEIKSMKEIELKGINEKIANIETKITEMNKNQELTNKWHRRWLTALTTLLVSSMLFVLGIIYN